MQPASGLGEFQVGSVSPQLNADPQLRPQQLCQAQASSLGLGQAQASSMPQLSDSWMLSHNSDCNILLQARES